MTESPTEQPQQSFWATSVESLFPAHVLVVSPETDALAAALGDTVNAMGGSPLRVSSLEDALTVLTRTQPTLVAISLSDEAPALNLVRRLRFVSASPIVVFGEREQGSAVAQALEAGADGYLTNVRAPAAVRAAIGRHEPITVPSEEAVLSVRDLTLDMGRFQATVAGTPVGLTPTEFRLLAALVREAGRVVSAQHLVREVYGHNATSSEAMALVKTHIARLRAKLRPLEGPTPFIRNVRGFGYMLERRTATRPDDVFAPLYSEEDAQR